ncbi:MAG: hypothetical protein V4662_00245 [Verrucomicrobiota bacterium]
MKSLLKRLVVHVSIAVVLVSPALAKPPVVHEEMGKTLNVARKKEKLGIYLLGTASCTYCKALKRRIEEGEVSINADSFVMADLNERDPQVRNAFFKQFDIKGVSTFTMPYVVIASSRGKLLVSWTGPKNSPAIEKLVQEAKSKAAAK